MKNILVILALVIPSAIIRPQTDADSAINRAYQNARKGISWALTNIPGNKLRVSHDLIAENKLIAAVKLDVEINGVKLISTGFENSTEVSITTYKSIANLEKEGYLKNKSLRKPGEEE